MSRDKAAEEAYWVATVHVWPNADDGRNPGFATVVGRAVNESQFRERVVAELLSVGELVVEWEDVTRWNCVSQSDYVRGLIDRVSDDWPVQYETVHRYPAEDSDA